MWKPNVALTQEGIFKNVCFRVGRIFDEPSPVWDSSQLQGAYRGMNWPDLDISTFQTNSVSKGWAIE